MEKRFSMGTIGILHLIVYSLLLIIITGLIINLIINKKIFGAIMLISFNFILFLPAVILLLTNNKIIIQEDKIIFPRQARYDGKYGFIGDLNIFAFIKKKPIISIQDITFLRYNYNYLPVVMCSAKDPLRNLLTINSKVLGKKSFTLIRFNKTKIIELIKNLKKMNPSIKLSNECSNLIN